MDEGKSAIIRAFFAFDIDEPLRAAITLAIKHLQKQQHGDKVKWIDPKNLHVTLRFLGEIPHDKLMRMTEEVLKQLSVSKIFTLEVGKIISFPISHPHVIALLFHLSKELAELSNKIEKAANQCGFEPEGRPYLPHLTLGRLRSSHQLPICDNIPVEIPKTLTIKEIILFQSELQAEGSVYIPLRRINLC